WPPTRPRASRAARGGGCRTPCSSTRWTPIGRSATTRRPKSATASLSLLCATSSPRRRRATSTTRAATTRPSARRAPALG
ncbi:hypothetical protein M885DRAFT_615061, partial [Pelagophyceae sp. CCMP2097]